MRRLRSISVSAALLALDTGIQHTLPWWEWCLSGKLLQRNGSRQSTSRPAIFAIVFQTNPQLRDPTVLDAIICDRWANDLIEDVKTRQLWGFTRVLEPKVATRENRFDPRGRLGRAVMTCLGANV
jgi:hypothetical protein